MSLKAIYQRSMHEINAPSGGGDLEITNVGHDHRHDVTINTRIIDEKPDSSNL